MPKEELSEPQRYNSYSRMGIDSTQKPNHSGAIEASETTEEEKEQRQNGLEQMNTSFSNFNTEVMKFKKENSSTTEDELQELADAIYFTDVDMFGTSSGTAKWSSTGGPSRRNREISDIKREKKCLRRRWLNAPKEKKAGLKVLYEDVKKLLRFLLHSERRKDRRQTKRKCRKKFLENPYKVRKMTFPRKQKWSPYMQ